MSVRAGLYPGKIRPVGRLSAARRLPFGVRLVGARHFALDTRAVARRDLRDGIAHRPLSRAGAAHEDRARPVAGADKDVLRPGRAVEEVPLLQPPLLSLDDEDALAGENEEVFLLRLAVVAAVRLAGHEDVDAHADLLEVSSERGLGAGRALVPSLARQPLGIDDVDDEPVLGHASSLAALVERSHADVPRSPAPGGAGVRSRKAARRAIRLGGARRLHGLARGGRARRPRRNAAERRHRSRVRRGIGGGGPRDLGARPVARDASDSRVGRAVDNPARDPRAPPRLASEALQLALDLPLRVARGDVAPLVAQLLALRERELDLHLARLEVELGRHDGEALLRDTGREPLELLAMEKELARPVGIVVRAVPLRVLRHVETEEPALAVTHLGVRLLQRRLPAAQRLDLRPLQNETGFEPVAEVVLVARAAVLDDELLSFGVRCGHGGQV